MPLGFYGNNPPGPGGLASIVLSYTTLNGATQPMTAPYAVNVVPTPGVWRCLALAC